MMRMRMMMMKAMMRRRMKDKMKEYTITKTLFKMKKTHTTVRVKRRRELYEGKFVDSFLWGRICETDLMTFASVLGH